MHVNIHALSPNIFFLILSTLYHLCKLLENHLSGDVPSLQMFLIDCEGCWICSIPGKQWIHTKFHLIYKKNTKMLYYLFYLCLKKTKERKFKQDFHLVYQIKIVLNLVVALVLVYYVLKNYFLFYMEHKFSLNDYLNEVELIWHKILYW